jgi:hypothetical protein
MRVHLTPQAQERLGHSALVLLTARVDAGALRIGQRGKRGGVEGRDRPLPRHWQPRRVRWGGTAVRWLASLLPEGDHRKVSVAADRTGMHHPLSHLSGQRLAPRRWP